MGAKCLKCLKHLFWLSSAITDYMNDAEREKIRKEDLETDFAILSERVSDIAKDECFPKRCIDDLMLKLSSVKLELDEGYLMASGGEARKLIDSVISCLRALSNMCQKEIGGD